MLHDIYGNGSKQHHYQLPVFLVERHTVCYVELQVLLRDCAMRSIKP